jgi:drug/metabolite transporter (DMT)-like permease
MGATSFLLFFYTMNNMAIGMAYFLYYATNTIGGYFLGRLFFHEKITPIKWLAFGLALFGLSFIYALNLSQVAPLLVLSAILAGALCSGWFIIVKKVKDYPSQQLTFLDLVIPFVLYTIVSIILREPWTMPQLTQTWIASFIYGACFIITGQLIVFGFKKVEAQIGSLIMLAEIPIATFLAYLIYQERITLFTALGGILILVAMTLPELAALKKREK